LGVLVTGFDASSFSVVESTAMSVSPVDLVCALFEVDVEVVAVATAGCGADRSLERSSLVDLPKLLTTTCPFLSILNP
jgi:hypothetical protein